jgi:hypothetical protein
VASPKGWVYETKNTLSEGWGFCPNKVAEERIVPGWSIKKTLAVRVFERAKMVEARMRSPLRLRAPNKASDFAIGDQTQFVSNSRCRFGNEHATGKRVAVLFQLCAVL